MSHLVPQQPAVVTGTIRRFEPAYWDVNSNLECACTIITTGANSMRVQAEFISNHDFIGVNWRSIDKWDHPLFGYRTNKDYTNCTLQFQLDYAGSYGLSNVNGPTMTVIDLAGNAYIVRLFNYAVGTDFSSLITLPFPNVFAGFFATDVIPWTQIDYMYIGFPAVGYDISLPLAPITLTEFQADFTAMAITGINSTIGLGDTGLTPHELSIAEGYGDSYPQTPERIVRQITKLGYATNLNIYVGFDHFNSLSWNAGVGDFQIDVTMPPLNVPTQQWFFDYAQRLATAGLSMTISVSYEQLARFLPDAWAQKDYNGVKGQSGWTPPSAFVSPCSAPGMAYLQDVSAAFVTLCRTAGVITNYQVGEPWWWDGSYGGTGPCFYDASTVAAYTAESGGAPPVPRIQTIYDTYANNPAQVAFLNWLQLQLGNSTQNLRDFVKLKQPGTACSVLFYTPTVLNPLSPMLTVVNFPTPNWTRPQWDFVQIEDYQVVEVANWYQNIQDINVPASALGYPSAEAMYFSGFNLLPQTLFLWDYVDQAIYYAELKVGSWLVWARPQVCRDGFVFDHSAWPTYAAVAAQPAYPVFPAITSGGANIQAFPVTRAPEFNTQVSRHVSGREIRSPLSIYPIWKFEVSYEVLKTDSVNNWLQQIQSFFENMKGRDGLFAFSDPENATLTGQVLGTGDGFRRSFTIVRTFGGFTEPVRAVSGVPTVKVNGVAQVPVTDYVLNYNDAYPAVFFNVGDEPALGAVVTIDMSPLFVCRFSEDIQTYEQFTGTLHSLKSVKFETAKP